MSQSTGNMTLPDGAAGEGQGVGGQGQTSGTTGPELTAAIRDQQSARIARRRAEQARRDRVERSGRRAAGRGLARGAASLIPDPRLQAAFYVSPLGMVAGVVLSAAGVIDLPGPDLVEVADEVAQDVLPEVEGQTDEEREGEDATTGIVAAGVVALSAVLQPAGAVDDAARMATRPRPIAVGLSGSATHRRGLVGRFAEAVGADTYWDVFPGPLPSNAEILRRMSSLFGERSIMINLSGLSQVESNGVNAGLRALIRERHMTVTEGEIATVIRSENFFGRARFFLNGDDITALINRASILAE